MGGYETTSKDEEGTIITGYDCTPSFVLKVKEEGEDWVPTAVIHMDLPAVKELDHLR